MILYNLSIRLLQIGIYLAQFINPKAKKWILGRQDWRKKLPVLEKNKEVIWFHCASLGEFDQGLPLMQKLKNDSNFLVVTFFSASGLENYHKRINPVDFACYLPLDTKKNAEDFISHFKPRKFFIVKYEFWCNFIFQAKKSNVKIYSISAIFRPNQRFFKWYGSIFRKGLTCFDKIFVQNKSSVNLLETIDIKNSILVGDLRFDKVFENRKNVKKDEILESFLGNNTAFIIGSSWKIDEIFLKDTILSRNVLDKKVVIAAHDISEKHIHEIEQLFENKTIKYSEFLSNFNNQNILILDCIGKLSNAYSYGDFAYIGGGFTGKLHNILEAIAFGLPIIIGPKHKKFPEAQQVIDEGFAFSVSNQSQLENAIEIIEKSKAKLSENAINFVLNNKGVVDKIMLELDVN
jgi:3-deoxy-D-manno-octulosonic-acid transferase